MSSDADPLLPEGFTVESRSASNGNTTNNNGIGTTGTIVLAIFVGLALGMSIYAQVRTVQAERESRMLEYYVMELDGKLMKEGIVDPGHSWSAQKKQQQESKP